MCLKVRAMSFLGSLKFQKFINFSFIKIYIQNTYLRLYKHHVWDCTAASEAERVVRGHCGLKYIVR